MVGGAMRQIKLAAAAVLILFAGVVSASAQCVGATRDITGRFPSLEAGPIAWTGEVLGIAGIQLSTGAIWISVADEHGNLLADRLRLLETEGGTLIDLVASDDEFALFFLDEERRLLMRRIETDGEAVGLRATEVVGDLVLHADDRAVVQYSAALDAYVVARSVTTTTPRELWLTILNTDGTPRSNVRLVTDVAVDSLLRLAITDEGVIGVFYEEQTTNNIRLVRVEAGVRQNVATVWGPVEDDDLVVTAHAGQFVMIRSMHEFESSFFLWKIVSTYGDVTRPENLLLFGTGEEVRGVSLISTGTELALSFLDAPAGFELQMPRYRLFRFSPTGDEISNTYFAAVNEGIRRAITEYDFIWTGTAYVSPAVLETGDIDESYLVRYCPLFAGALGPRTATRGETITFTGHATGGAPPYDYEWRISGGDPVTGPTVDVMYTQLGRFPVEVTVRDSSGAEATERFFVDVVDVTRPKRRSVRK
jgi:hypothetical protein